MAGHEDPSADTGGREQGVDYTTSDASEPADDGPENQLVQLPVSVIRPNPLQPRQAFDEGALKRLARSLATDGMMQPVIVRPASAPGNRSDDGPMYELVAGERRWRAAKLVGMTHVPAVVRDLDDRQLAEWALIENLQREDLNPIERAEAFQRLIDQFALSHEQIAERVGVQRSTITNTLRLLALQEGVRQLVRDGLLSPGQAKALAGIEDAAAQRELAMQAVREGWSVRQVESAAREASGGAAAVASGGGAASGNGKPKKGRRRSAHLADLEKQIAETLGTKVRLTAGSKKGTGTLSIEFYSLEQFEGLLETLGVKAA